MTLVHDVPQLLAMDEPLKLHSLDEPHHYIGDEVARHAEEEGNGGATASTPESIENNTGFGGRLIEEVSDGNLVMDVDAPSG